MNDSVVWGDATDGSETTFGRTALDMATIQEASWVTVAAAVIVGGAAVTPFDSNQTAISNALDPVFYATDFSK